MASPNPRIVREGPLLLTGWVEEHAPQTMAQTVPMQWRQFQVQLAYISGRASPYAYGVWYNVLNNAPKMGLFIGVATMPFGITPQSFVKVTLPEWQYAVFPHAGHVSQVRDTMAAAMREWLPSSEYQREGGGAQDPDVIERYGPGFDAATGMGDIEIWLPVKKK